MKKKTKLKLSKKTLKNLKVKLKELAQSPLPELNPSNTRSC